MSITRIARRTAVTALIAAGLAGSGSVASAQAAGSCGPAADAVPTATNIRAVEDAMICLANEYRVDHSPWFRYNDYVFNSGKLNPLTYNRALQVVAEQDAASVVKDNALPAAAATNRADAAGYKMGYRCRTNDIPNWVRTGMDWENDGYRRNTARFAMKEIMKDLGTHVADTKTFINIGAGVAPKGASGVKGATFTIAIGQCKQG